jgi:hypothetical protein
VRVGRPISQERINLVHENLKSVVEQPGQQAASLRRCRGRRMGRTIVGWSFLASVKRPAMSLLDSPYHLLAKLERGTLICSV